MSVNIVSFSRTGGAGNVARTLVEGFSKIGLEANLIVAMDGNLHLNPLERPLLTLKASFDNYLVKSSEWKTLISLSRDRYSALEDSLGSADMTIFRWMNGLLGESFLTNNPEVENLVWGLDDMNPFTGVCHYSGECRGFETGCKGCPALRKPFAGGANQSLNKKILFADRFNPSYVSPTDWINQEFRSSMLGKDRESLKILNPLPSRFFVEGRQEASNSAQLRVLIVAANLDDPAKGVWDVVDVLSQLLKQACIALTMVGRASKKLRSQLHQADFLGQMDSQGIIEAMNRHDVLLVPSLFENAGTVVAEAASQSLPTIARRVGGMPEMTNYGDTGFLFDVNADLVQIINSSTKQELKAKGKLAKDWAQQLKPELIAAKYAESFL
jgi:glycosyltransferase involved in cell wall biosynthesis